MSLILGVFFATLGYRHRVWSRAQLARRIDDPRRPSSTRHVRRATVDR
jgi:hypothetical protein